ncbi:MAG: RNB domain-containing ribonuclease, partial [Cyanobacteria bacterium REEB67]|nr:RNB domain-containing ribonuclease [Cyanobacteria bacterium REEB67]
MDSNGAVDLPGRARIEMLKNGFKAAFDPQAIAQAAKLSDRSDQQSPDKAPLKDLRNLLWSSIDNVESQDLDQIE